MAPRELCIFIIKKYVYRIIVSKETFDLIMKNASLVTDLPKYNDALSWLSAQ